MRRSHPAIQLQLYVAHGLGFIYLTLSVMMLATTIKKWRCHKKSKDKDENAGSKPLALHLELALYAFYALSILWSAAYILSFAAMPLMEQLGSGATTPSVCHTIVILLLWSGFSYQILLVTILCYRVRIAFEDTPYELSKRTYYGIQLMAPILWWAAFAFFIAGMFPSEMEVDHDCLCLVNRSIPVTVFLLNLAGPMGLWLLFVTKLLRLREFLQTQDPAGDFILDLVKKQSVIMFWVAFTTVAISVVHIFSHGQIGCFSHFWWGCDFAANSIAIFISFDQKWYFQCRCNQCADCCCGCAFEIRSKNAARISLELAMRSQETMGAEGRTEGDTVWPPPNKKKAQLASALDLSSVPSAEETETTKEIEVATATKKGRESGPDFERREHRKSTTRLTEETRARLSAFIALQLALEERRVDDGSGRSRSVTADRMSDDLLED